MLPQIFLQVLNSTATHQVYRAFHNAKRTPPSVAGKRNAILLWLFVFLLLGPLKAQENQKSGKDFTIAVLPDTQYYSAEMKGGTKEIFLAQTEWIVDNWKKENIVYVIHVGDIVQSGDKKPEEWDNAVEALYKLEEPQPGLPYGIPYGLAVGNHDQDRSQFALSGETYYYNKYFGVDHFEGRPYYGGHYRDDNDSHYDLFSAGGLDFIVIYIEYDAFDEDQDNMNNWAVDLLDKYSDRKAIVVSHYLIGFNPVTGTNLGGKAEFGKQGQRIYDRLKTKPNLFLMLSGHVGANGEGYRQDTYSGHTIKTMLADYQSRPNGGNGLMRLLRFSPEKDLLSVETFSPYTDLHERDGDSEFQRPLFREPTASRIYDFNNDGKSDVVTFKNGIWNIGDSLVEYGKPGDIAVPGNYYGNGKASLAVYSPDEATFRIKGMESISLGKPGDIPIPHDYDGDGITEVAVWRPSNATWYIKGKEPFGRRWKESFPVPADYDGDGAAELGIFRVKNHTWYIAKLGNVRFGQKGDIPVPGDYTGNGKADVAVFRPSTGEWLIMGSKDKIVLGKEGDVPVPGDYDGSGRLQPAVFDPSTKMIRTSSGLKMSIESDGQLINLPYHLKQFLN